ncbi:ELKS/Rab6-interacting/CAST family member 1-like [Seriola aureovittata]|uniref:ELKS/Rab6-interacting/CAST family member 1-like n=1 Tax=Seriola aureovittata TaxID=2871759 RepID=UPI0024BD94CC|nr:ELKS/Rab6-interacting/CAST family member 1-like [Seriola aureovittata]
MSVSEIREELQRTQKNEKRLIDKNKELQRQISFLIKAETSLKKEQVEVAKLKRKAGEQDLHVDKLRKDLHKVKTELVNEQTHRAQEKTVSEQRIVSLEKQCHTLQDKYSVEKMMREQREKDLELFNQIKGEKKKLTLQGQNLHHQVQELTGYKNFAVKTMEEMKQLLKKKDAEHEQTKGELNIERAIVKNLHEQNDKLVCSIEACQGVENETARRGHENERYRRQIEADKKKAHHLKMEIRDLLGQIDDLKNSHILMEHQLDMATQASKHKTEELEHQISEAGKQRHLILSLEHQVNKYNELKHKLQNRKQKEAGHSQAKNQEIINMRTIICELESKQRQQLIINESMQGTRDLAIKNLFTAQAKITEQDKAIEQLNGEIREETREINAKKIQVNRIRRDYRSVKNQLEEMKKQLSETKITQDMCSTTADKDQLLAQKNMAKMQAEKEKLEKDLEQYKEQLVQQQQKINLQDATKIKQGNTLKEYELELKSLRLKNTELENNCDILTTHMINQSAYKYVRGEEKTQARKTHLLPCLKKADEKADEVHEKNQQLEEKNQEIEELKCRSKEAVQKFHVCQWDNRQLRERLMALQGMLTAYEDNYKSKTEEVKRLSDELRKINLETREKSRYRPLSPVLSKTQAPSEENSESVYLSQHTRFPLRSTKFQCQSGINAETFLPPIHKIQSRPGLSFSTQPHPPSESKSGHIHKLSPRLQPQPQPQPQPEKKRNIIVLPPINKIKKSKA